MKKSTFRFLTTFTAIACACVAALGLAKTVETISKAEVIHSKVCASITFGNTKTTQSTATTEGEAIPSTAYTLSGSFATDENLALTAGPKAYADTAGKALKIGTTSVFGNFTISFSPVAVTGVYLYASCATTSSKYTDTTAITNASVSFGSDSNSTTVQIQGKTAPSSLEDLSNAFYVENPGSASTSISSLKIATTEASTLGPLQIYKIVFSIDESIYTSESDMADPISFHFLELGNQYTGDSTYIKAGDNDILIDAGSRDTSAATIEAYLEDSSRSEYVEDNKLEYVIATHGHQDHIAGMVGTSKGGILYRYDIDNIIDFSYFDNGKNNTSTYPNQRVVINNADPTNSKGNSLFVGYKDTYQTTDSSGNSKTSYYASAVYRNYVDARSAAVAKGASWKTAGELTTLGNNKVIELGKGLTMTILYNHFYDHTHDDLTALKTDGFTADFSVQNDDSVCLLFSQETSKGTKHFLFTGDAEAYAEHSLVLHNDLPQVDLFKAGHHGSYTASSAELLSVIQPKVVCVCCCAGNPEYTTNSNHQFPSQEFCDRVAPYTDEVYVTTIGDSSNKDYFASMNGNIRVGYDGSGTRSIAGSNNNIKLKDTEWFANNRTCPAAWA